MVSPKKIFLAGCFISLGLIVFSLVVFHHRIKEISFCLGTRSFFDSPKEKIIRFYKTDQFLGEFSNYYQQGNEGGFFLEDIWWPTSEHYFHAQKFKYLQSLQPSFYQQIVFELLQSLPKVAHLNLANGKYRNYIDLNWHNGIKQDAMKKAVLAKFSQNERLKNLLLNTKNALLQEDNPHDYVWGIGADGKGENLLGKILMEVRDIFRKQESFKVTGDLMVIIYRDALVNNIREELSCIEHILSAA